MKKFFVAFCAVLIILLSFVVFAVSADTAPQDIENLKQSSATTSSVTLKWSSGKNCNCYAVYQYSKKDKEYKLVDIIEGTKITIDNLSAFTSYKFKVKGAYYDESYNMTYSKGVVFKAKTAPKAPKKLYADDIGYDYINLKWSKVKGVTGYRVYLFSRDEGKYVKLGATHANNYKVEGLYKNTIYSFKVVAYYKEEELFVVGEGIELLEFTDTKSEPHTNSQAAERYNEAVNGEKSAKNVTVSYTKAISTEAVSTSKAALLRTEKNILNMFDGKKSETKTFSSGVSDGTKLNAYIQPYSKSASLRGIDVKSFSYNIDDGETSLVLALVKDSSTLNRKTKSVSSSSSTSRAVSHINIMEKKITPVKILSGTQNYENTKLTLKFSAKGKLVSMKLKSKVNVQANCKVSGYKFKAVANYKVTETYTFS